MLVPLPRLTAWALGPSGDADEESQTLASGSVLYVDPTGPDNLGEPAMTRAVIDRVDGTRYVVTAYERDASFVANEAAVIDAAADAFPRTQPVIADVAPRALATKFVIDGGRWMDPPPSDLAPALDPQALDSSTKLSSSGDHGLRRLRRFGMYHGLDASEPVPAWLLIDDGVLMMPSCPPAVEPANACHAVPGYRVTVIADRTQGGVVAGAVLSGSENGSRRTAGRPAPWTCHPVQLFPN